MRKNPAPKSNLNFRDNFNIINFHKIPKASEIVIDIENSYVTSEGIAKLMEQKNNSTVKSINLSSNSSSINNDALFAIANSESFKKIQEINCKDSNISDEGVLALCKSANSEEMRTLSFLGCYNVTDIALTGISNSQWLCGLRELNFSNTGISDFGIWHFTGSVNSKFLKKLDVSHNKKNITDETLMAISSSNHLTSLRYLNLQGTSVSSKGIIRLMESPNSSFIEELNISGEKFKRNEKMDDKAVIAISNSLYMTKLRILEAKYTSITSKGVNFFLTSVNCWKLEILNLMGNTGVIDSTAELVATSQSHKELLKINFTDTEVRTLAIEKLLKYKGNLQIIYYFG